MENSPFLITPSPVFFSPFFLSFFPQCSLCPLWLYRYSLHAVHQSSVSKIDQQAPFQSGRFQIRDHLRGRKVRQFRDRLQLNDDLILNQEVQPLSHDSVTLINHIEWRLALVDDPAQVELNTQSLFVDRFEQSGSKTSVHFNRRCDDGFGNRIPFHVVPLFSL